MTVVNNGVKNIINDVGRDNVGFVVNRCSFLLPLTTLMKTGLKTGLLRTSLKVSLWLEGRSRKKEWTS